MQQPDNDCRKIPYKQKKPLSHKETKTKNSAVPLFLPHCPVRRHDHSPDRLTQIMRDSHTEPCFISFQQSAPGGLSHFPFPTVLHQPTALYHGFGTLLLPFAACIFLNVVYIIKAFSQNVNVFPTANMRKLSCIFLCFFAILHNAKHVQFYSGKLCDFHKRRRCSRMAVPLLRTLILYCAVICAVRLMGKRQIGELDPSELVVTILSIRSGGCAHAGFRGSAALRSGADRHARGARDFPQPPHSKSRRFRRLLNGRPSSSAGDSSILASCGKCG